MQDPRLLREVGDLIALPTLSICESFYIQEILISLFQLLVLDVVLHTHQIAE
ncbi:hypothetical protein NUACC26_100240 [Scytonema sp. NUACC26]